MKTEKTRKYLEEAGFILTDTKAEEIRKSFGAEMKAGLEGEESSLMMLPTYITAEGNVPEGERVIVIDAGGTNFRVAVCRFAEKGIEVEYFNKSHMPGSDRPIDIEEFFDTVADQLLPIIDKSRKIGVCFSYAAKVLPNKDAEIIALSKQVVINNSKGALVCKGIAEALKRKGVTEEKSFVLINDTVAAMLGAQAECDRDKYCEFVGFILGTGTNIAYSEDCSAITKSTDIAQMEGSMIINMESGFFDKVPRNAIDLEIDSETTNPGASVAEKLISGAYMGEVCRRAIIDSARFGAVSERTAEGLKQLGELQTADVSPFLEGKPSLLDSMTDPEDRQSMLTIVEAVFARSAEIVAAELAAIYERKGLGDTKPACVCAEGSTVNKNPIYKPLIEQAVEKRLTRLFGTKITFVYVEDATLKGTALAAALNCQ